MASEVPEPKGAFTDLGDSRISSQIEPDMNYSRPPSYNTVSITNQLALESAQRAQAIRDANTDVKSVVSVGDRDSVDETNFKRAVDHGDDDDDDDDENHNTDNNSPDYSQLMNAIEELQVQQEQLRKMHEEHDKKLEELLLRQPAVKEQLQLIKQKSLHVNDEGMQNSSTPQYANVDSDACSGADRNNGSTTGAPAKNSSSSSSNNTVTNFQEGGSSDGGADVNNSPDELEGKEKSQVTKRKFSKTAARNENVIGAFQKLFLTDQQHHVYVQLEQLYANFQRVHLPSKTVQGLMGGALAFAADAFPDSSSSAARDASAAAAGEDWQSSDDRETVSLRRENEQLRKQNQELQQQIEMLRRRKAPTTVNRTNPPPLPPKPAPSTAGMQTNARSRREAQLQRMKTVDRTSGEPTENKESFLKPPSPSKTQLFVAGRPTSPMTPRKPPADIDIWEISVHHKIFNYSRKLQQEKLTQGRKQISNPFYITHGGYRAQLEVFLNGNGTGYNKCMSVFVRVIPGENDNFLKWPVNLYIRPTLMEQNRGISHSVEDRGNQFQFSRPRGTSDEESDSWGLIEFVCHDMMQQASYIMDDTIVLRCKLRFMPGSNGEGSKTESGQ